MVDALKRVIGPRVPDELMSSHGGRYRLPALIFTLARVALLVSIFLPYWKMELVAPQYPDGLRVSAYVDRLTGDVREIDGLNHYIGMRPLNDAAQIERRFAVPAIIVLLLLMEGAVFLHSRWAALLALPVIAFPPIFLLDLYLWLDHFGQNLDPDAALSNAIDPFTPPVLGVGVIGQFKTIATPGGGLILATAAAVLVIVGLYFHRRAYKPLVDRTTGAAHA